MAVFVPWPLPECIFEGVLLPSSPLPSLASSFLFVRACHLNPNPLGQEDSRLGETWRWIHPLIALLLVNIA